jgi:uncharacterized membrane protein
MSGKTVLGGLALALFSSYFSPVLGGLVLVALVVALLLGRNDRPRARPGDGLDARVEDFERRLDELYLELQELKAMAASVGSQMQPATPRPAHSTHPTEPEARVAPPEPEAVRTSTPPPPRPPRTTREWNVSPSDLLGARALAWAGGIVTLLGIVFFFVLAADRGWINPELRLGFGGLASVAAFAAGFWLRRRYGQLYSALAAAGAGIAGGFATLLAATALYEFVPELWALVCAAAIAAGAVATALAWRAQLVAALGLIGAMAVPLMVVIEEQELSLVGTSFVTIVLGATAIVAIEQRWRELLLVGAGVALPQIGGLVAQTDGTDWGVVLVAGISWFLLLGAGLGYQLRAGMRALEPLTATFVLAGAMLAGYSSAWLFAGQVGGVDREGAALFVVAVVHGVLGAWFFRGRRDLAALLWATGLTVAAVAAAELLSHAALTVAWAGEAAILAWLAEATRERRFQLTAFAYLALAVGYTLAVSAPPTDLFELSVHPAAGGLSVLAVAAATTALAWFTRAPFERPDREGPLASFLGDLVALVRVWPAAYAWLAGLALTYAASLGLLEVVLWMRFEDTATRFERGHVAVSCFWALLALALVEAGMRRRDRGLEIGGLLWLGATVTKVVAFDGTQLADERWPLSALVVGAAALLAAHEYQRLGRLPALRAETVLTHMVSVGLTVAAVLELGDGDWLLVPALVYGALGASILRRDRELATLEWGTGLVLAAAGAGELLEDLYLVLAWTAAAAVLAWLAGAAREVRFQIFSAGFLALGLGYTLVREAPPRDFFVAAAHPGEGAPSLAFVVLAALAFAFFARHETTVVDQDRVRLASVIGSGVLALYGLSLTILEIAEAVSTASIETGFQRGHTAVSAFWALVGVALLYLGLKHSVLGLRLAGFGLFGVSLVKLFLYDLAFLSSLARSLSFLVVGALLLLGGFFYQRLSQLEDRDRSAGGNAAA